MFYVDGIKIIPSNIGEHFTAVSLAYFFMDDGYKSRAGFYFCTESFTKTTVRLAPGYPRFRYFIISTS